MILVGMKCDGYHNKCIIYPPPSLVLTFVGSSRLPVGYEIHGGV